MLDQSHNVTDPLESLMTSAAEVVRAYVQAHLVDRTQLAEHQDGNDALLALQTLKQAFQTDVEPILAMARHRAGGAIDPVASTARAATGSAAAEQAAGCLRGSQRRDRVACRMIRKAFRMSVHPDRHEEYTRRHNPIWPELESTLLAHGVRSYSIYLDPDDERALRLRRDRERGALEGHRRDRGLPAMVAAHARADAVEPRLQPGLGASCARCSTSRADRRRPGDRS